MHTLQFIPGNLRSLALHSCFYFSAMSCLLLLSQCTDKVEVTRRYTYLKPVYTTTEELRSAFEIMPPQPVKTPGKIYFLNGYLFINEPNEGIHIIDNTDPANPVNVSFINIPGNFDLAGKGNILYADSYIDLLALDISDVHDVREVKRVENVFPLYNSYGFYPDTERGIVTSWEEEEVIETFEREMTEFAPGWYYYHGGIALSEAAAFDFASNGAPSSGSTAAGTGGSMARFTIVDHHLYTIDSYNMQLFDITTLDNPKAGNEISVGFNIETIFPYENKLFIGAQNGMYIYDNSNPENPVHLSTYEHVTSCDPVVVQNDKAYVTLRDGNECNGFTNQLEVVDVSDASNPQLIATYAMDHPHGLGIDGNTLFICEGEFGLKVFDAQDDKKIDEHLIAHFKDIHAYDVIPLNQVLMMIGEGGLYQYDYSDPTDIKFLSKITTLAF